MPWTLFRVLLRETLGLALITLLGMTVLFVFVLLMQASARFPNAAPDVLFTFVPAFASGYQTFLLPIALLTACALVYSRLGADAELTALRACGVPVWKVMTPPALLGLVCSALAWQLAFHTAPEAYVERSRLGGEAVSSALRSLAPGPHELVFNDVAISYRDVEAGVFDGLVIRTLKDGRPDTYIAASQSELIWVDTTGSLLLRQAENAHHLVLDDSTGNVRTHTAANVRVIELRPDLSRQIASGSPKALKGQAFLDAVQAEHAAFLATPSEDRPFNGEYVRKLCFVMAPLLLALFGAALGGLFTTRNAMLPASISLLTGSAIFFGMMQVIGIVAEAPPLFDAALPGMEALVVLGVMVTLIALLIRRVQRV